VFDDLLVDLTVRILHFIVCIYSNFWLRLQVGYKSFGTAELCSSLSAFILSVFDHCVHHLKRYSNGRERS